MKSLLLFILITIGISASAQDEVLSVIDGALDSLVANGGAVEDERNVVGDSLKFHPVDSSFIRDIEELLEQKERESKAREVIDLSEKNMLRQEMKFNADGVQPVLRGVVMAFTEKRFNERKAMFRRYDMDTEDYGVAVLPLAASWVLKATGVESRSTLKRMLTANAMALAISGGVVKSLKLAVNEQRPDIHGNDAFPSGHSSFAFVGATILHREFGHHSPWISVGGYATATATQMLRLKHNRHWVHDTFVGAGIGIMSTNLAYFITDKIFGEEEINRPRLMYDDMIRVLKYNTCPTSVTFVSGTEVGNRTVEADELDVLADYDGGAKVRVGAGFVAGMEGSWFLNSNFALDAMAKYSTSKAKVVVSGSARNNPVLYGENLDFYRFNVGARYSLPFDMENRISFRLHLGTRVLNGVDFRDYETNSIFAKISDEVKLDAGGSVAYDCITGKKYAWGFCFDFHHTFSDIMPNRYGVSTVWKIIL
jgi:hypothetical protein